MINILIVDDEPIAADGMSIYLEEHAQPDWSIFTAYSGEDAVSRMKQRVDILLTDIVMPGMDGFELQAYLQRRWPMMKTVFLTGNGQVELAQKAMRRSNAVDFVLKMEDDVNVLEAIRKASAALDQEEAEQSILKQAWEEVRQAMPLLQKAFLLSAIRGALPEGLYAERMAKLEMPLRAEQGVLLLAVHLNEALQDGQSSELAEGIMDAILEKYFFPLYRFQSVTVTERRIAVLIQSAIPGEEIDIHHVFSLLEGAQASFSRSAGSASFVLNETVCSWESVSRHYRALALTLENNLGEADDTLILQSRQTVLPESVPLQEMHVIRTLLEHGQYEQAEQACRRLTCPHTAAGRIDQYRQLLKIYAHAASAGKNAEAILQASAMPVLRLNKEGWHQTQSEFAQLFRSMANLEQAPLQKKEKLLRTICDYVDGHLAEDLSLTQLAEVTRHSAPYLSKFFADAYGMNYNAYVVNRRLARSEELLRNTSLSVSEIVEQTGYRSSSYFIHAFRKRYGMTPVEFRNRTGSRA